MIFIVVFISLLVERFFDWSHLRNWRWFTAFQRLIVERFPQKPAYFNLALSIVPVLLAVLFTYHALHSVLYSIPKLIFSIFVLLYSFGPRSLWEDAFGCINAVSEGDSPSAAERLKKAFGMSVVRNSKSLHRELLSNIFIAANRRIFAVLFWYLLLGPVAAVCYRLIAISAGSQEGKANTVPALSYQAQTVEMLLDWLPARILTFFFALSGHFVQVVTCWRKKNVNRLENSDTLLAACGAAAVGVDDLKVIPEDCSVERAAVSMLDRSFGIFLIVVALVLLV